MYLTWEEVEEQQKRHDLRFRDITLGKTTMDADIETAILSGDWTKIATYDGEKVGLLYKGNPVGQVHMSLEWQKGIWAKMMADYCEAAFGPVWEWLQSIHGIGPALASKLFALIDDIEKFDTISKLWRHAGHGIYYYWVDAEGNVKAPRDGWKARKGKKGEWTLYGRLVEPETPDARPVVVRGSNSERVNVWTVTEPEPGWTLEQLADRNLPGWVSSQNKALKSSVWLCGDQFVRQRTPVYRDIYDQEKERLRIMYPERIKTNGRVQYNDGHLHAMAMRKARKIFLQHLWLVWREAEGLPVSVPWIISIGGHQDLIPPPNWPLEPNSG